MPSPRPNRMVYTTGQIAKILGVAPRTVAGWIDTGKLKGYRVPGGHRSTDVLMRRHVQREDLVDFMSAYGFPMHLLPAIGGHIILASPFADLTDELEPLLKNRLHAKVTVTPSLFDLGQQLHRQVRLVVLDTAFGRSEVLALLPRLHYTTVVVLAAEDEAAVVDWPCAQVYRRPFEVSGVVRGLEILESRL